MITSSNLLTKEDANYRPCKNMTECCKDCASYKAPDKCDRVEGPVDATMTCDEFSEKVPGPAVDAKAAA